jgi:hypothetical protein
MLNICGSPFAEQQRSHNSVRGFRRKILIEVHLLHMSLLVNTEDLMGGIWLIFFCMELISLLI